MTIARPIAHPIVHATGTTWLEATKAALASADGTLPAAIADFESWRFAIPDMDVGDVASASESDLQVIRECTFNDWFAYTASSTTARTYTNASGVLANDLAVDTPRRDYSSGASRLLLENASTNLILNSETMSTQSVSTSAVAYTLSFYGTGTITLSGTSTAGPLVGTGANNRVTLTFTPSAGTLTLTVSGSVTKAQLETGSFPTSYIPTTASTVTRAIETARFSPLLEAVMQRSAATILQRGDLSWPNTTTVRTIIGQANADESLIAAMSSTTVRARTASASITTTLGSGDLGADAGIASAFNSSGRSLAANGGAVVSDATAQGSRAAVYLRRTVGGSYGDGRVKLVAIYPTRLSDASLQALAVA